MTMQNIAPAVYFLCFVASACCCGLLTRSYFRSRTPLLMWCAVCFLFLALNNLFLVIDLVLIEDIDFALVRILLALTAVGTLLYGFIWELD
jgi:hypothetical protein